MGQARDTIDEAGSRLLAILQLLENMFLETLRLHINALVDYSEAQHCTHQSIARALLTLISVFLTFREDRRPIRLADEIVMHPGGIGPVSLLSTYGFSIVIHDLYVPHSSTSLFSSNKLTREYLQTHKEVLEYPTHKWVNRHTGAIDFLQQFAPTTSRPSTRG